MAIVPLLPGSIWSLFMGLAIGNFATNPIFRLPRSEPLFAEDPFCDTCHAKLKPRDLFPVLSWLSTQGKCRYCRAPIPSAYTLTEALIGLFFLLCYLKWGFSEIYILLSFGITAWVMIAMMLTLSNFFSDRTLIACMVLGALLRTLQEGTVYGFGSGAFAGILVGASAWKLSRKPMVRDAASFPPYFKLLTAAGIWLTMPQFFTVCLAALASLIFKKQRPWMVEWTIITATTLILLSRSVY